MSNEQEPKSMDELSVFENESPAPQESEQPEVATPVPAAKDRMSLVETKQMDEVKAQKGADAVTPKEDRACPIQELADKLNELWAPVKEEITKGNPKGFTSLITDAFGIEVQSHGDRLPRVVIACSHNVYAVIDQIPVPGESTVTIEARLYAHIPAEVNDLIVPWLKKLGVWISDQTLTRPSAL